MVYLIIYKLYHATINIVEAGKRFTLLALPVGPFDKKDLIIVIKPDNKNQLKNSLTNKKIREIYEGILEYIREKFDDELIEITIVLDGELKTIINFYYIDKKNDVYVGTKLKNK